MDDDWEKSKCITSCIECSLKFEKEFQSNVRLNQTALKFKQINFDLTGCHAWKCGILKVLTFCYINIFHLLPLWFLFAWHIGSTVNKVLSLYCFSLYLRDVCNQFCINSFSSNVTGIWVTLATHTHTRACTHSAL